MTDRLLDNLRALDPETLVHVGAIAIRNRDMAEATDHLHALVWDHVGVLADQALIEKTTVGGAISPASLTVTGAVIAHGSRKPGEEASLLSGH